MAKVAGSLWVEADGLHYVDQFNREWYCPGVFVAGLAALTSLWITPDEKWLHYVNQETFAHFIVDAYGDRFAPINSSRVGSIWIDNSDNQLHWLAPYDANYNLNVRSHADVAAGIAHTDTHTDIGHTDTPHTDTAHTDVHGDFSHTDGHGDVPHQDFNDSAHGDFTDGGFAHGDFGDSLRIYHPDLIFADGRFDPDKWIYHADAFSPGGFIHEDYGEEYNTNNSLFGYNHAGTSHTDANTHADSPHGDTPHTDTHTDTPHRDTPPVSGHGDFGDVGAHGDSHGDAPHQDGHGDTHGDAHTDTPHVDYPIYVGP